MTSEFYDQNSLLGKL